MKKRKEIQEGWIRVYSFVIPTMVTALYLLFSVCNFGIFIEQGNKENIDVESLLDGIITFVTIIMGIFGFLIPTLVSNKKDCGMIEFFLEHTDQKLFVRKLKMLVVSGMVTVLLCLVLFLENILKEWVFTFGMTFLVWFLLFFVCNAYRFIGLILSLLIFNRKTNDISIKNEVGKQVVGQMSEEERRKLQESLSRKNGTP